MLNKNQNEPLNEKLRRLREEKGFTLSQVAQLIDRSRTTVNSYEIGKSVPPVNVIMKLAKLYGVKSDYLMDVADRPRYELSISNITPEQEEILLEINRLTIEFFRIQNNRRDRND